LGIRNEEGVLILSRYPIVDSKALFLPRELANPEDDHQRVALTAIVDVLGTLVSVTTSHLR
jgi:endonuclease/exonuclease/phosphatase family metal-dependent hydrolase